jgi:hypothetical protein
MEMEKEIYLPVGIDNYRNSYLVSNFGNVISVGYNKIMTPYILNGYKELGLWYNGKRSTHYVHRLVAMTFLTNNDELPWVNHKNGDKLDNNVLNLEWCTPQQNAEHSQQALGNVRKSKSINKLDLQGNFIENFVSAKEAARILKIKAPGIRKACSSGNKYMKFKWEYVIDERVEAPIGKQLEKYPEYIITSDGKVYSFHINKYMVLKKNQEGYISIGLYDNVTKKQKNYYVHILVAKLYLIRIDGKNVVNHKDFNKANNDYSNLEWTTSSENTQHYFDSKPKIPLYKETRVVEKRPNTGLPTAVIMCDLNGLEIKRYDKMSTASKESGASYSGISAACRGKQRMAGNYKWKYAN